jgi:predicted nucleic acid-binding protein
MPATVHDMASPGVRPDPLYLDTSVLRALHRADAGKGDPKDAAASGFVLAVVGGGSRVWTSVLAVEEACWSVLRRALIKRLGTPDLKEAKAHRPQDYSSAYQLAIPRVDALMAYLLALPIGLRGLSACPLVAEATARLMCSVARRLSLNYELETADLFHIAIAKLDGTDAIATLDKGFRDVDGIEVYTCT